MLPGDVAVLDVGAVDLLIRALNDLGYVTKGPVVRDGAIMPGPVNRVADMPVGWHDEQEPGRYRIVKGDDGNLFGWAVGPGSWKAEFFPATEVLWSTEPQAGVLSITPSAARRDETARVAIIGARPCELAALAVLDTVLREGHVPDPGYAARREGTFVVVAECGTPSATCFCTSMGTGPSCDSGFDLALCELGEAHDHRFLVRVGSERGAEVLSSVPVREASPEDLDGRLSVLARAESAIERRLDCTDLPKLLARNVDHPRWDVVAERCLACGNCTLVCPTCFCSDVRDSTDVGGMVQRERVWASCFDLDHSYLGGRPVRSSTSSRYRQWLTHKLSTWWDQFDTSGCVGCGRCIAWCPVGIDITEEATAIRATDGTQRGGSQAAAGTA
jgi:ferredoxin